MTNPNLFQSWLVPLIPLLPVVSFLKAYCTTIWRFPRYCPFMHSSAVGVPPGAPAAQHRADEVAPLQVMCAATAVDMCVEEVLPC